MASRAWLLLLIAPAAAFVAPLRVAHRPLGRRTSGTPATVMHPALSLRTPIQMGAVADVREAVTMPKDTGKKELRNVVGVPLFLWGAYSLLMPVTAAGHYNLNILAARSSVIGIALMRSLGVVNVLLGARICRDADADATPTGLVLLAGWAYMLYNALDAGTVSGRFARWSFAGCLAVSLSCLNRLWKASKFKLLDGVLKSLTPRAGKRDARFFSGSLLLGCGLVATFSQATIFGAANLLGVASTAGLSFLVSGIGLSAIVLAGRAYGATETQASLAAAIAIGGWAYFLPGGGESVSLGLMATIALVSLSDRAEAKKENKVKAKKVAAKKVAAKPKPPPPPKPKPPAGYQFDSFGRLVALPNKDSFSGI